MQVIVLSYSFRYRALDHGDNVRRFSIQSQVEDGGGRSHAPLWHELAVKRPCLDRKQIAFLVLCARNSTETHHTACYCPMSALFAPQLYPQQSLFRNCAAISACPARGLEFLHLRFYSHLEIHGAAS